MRSFEIERKRLIDIATEKPIALAEAAKLPELRHRGNRPVHVSTLHRWVTRGSGGIRLETVKFPNGMRTTREAVLRFIAALNGQSGPAATSAQRTSAMAAAERELDEAGIR